MTELTFVLDIDGGWPPVAKECLICSASDAGYRVEVPPLFVKDLSVGDIITVEEDDQGDVVAWSHMERSQRSTIWIMTYGDYSIESTIDCLKGLQCNIERFTEYRYFAIDVPEECSVDRLDECLEGVDEDRAAIAFPSFRHASHDQ